MPGPQKIKDKRATCEYIERETPNKSLRQLSDELGISPQRVHQYQKMIGAERPFKTMADALAEIRRLRAMLAEANLDCVKANVVDPVNQ